MESFFKLPKVLKLKYKIANVILFFKIWPFSFDHVLFWTSCILDGALLCGSRKVNFFVARYDGVLFRADMYYKLDSFKWKDCFMKFFVKAFCLTLTFASLVH